MCPRGLPVGRLAALVIAVAACAPPATREAAAVTASTTAGPPPPQGCDPISAAETPWTLYDADPDHLWNRLSRALLERTAADGSRHGWRSLDPLLWQETDFLLEGPPQRQALDLLDELLAGDLAVAEPVLRALLQRDLWAVFDWTTIDPESRPEARLALQRRLAQAIRRLALSEEEVRALPDNFDATIRSGAFAAGPQEDPTTPYIPPGLASATDGWLLLGQDGGPIAMTHTESFPFLGRSVFLVLVRRAPAGEVTAEFVEQLNYERGSRTLAALDLTGLEVALVRRAVLIDDHGRMVLSPLVESVQLRRFSPAQHFFQFELDRVALLRNDPSLCPVEAEIPLFATHGDPFQSGFRAQAPIPELCRGCHGDMVSGVSSVLSYSRFRFELAAGETPVLTPTSVEAETRAVLEWKRSHRSWLLLESLMGWREP